MTETLNDILTLINVNWSTNKGNRINQFKPLISEIVNHITEISQEVQI